MCLWLEIALAYKQLDLQHYIKSWTSTNDCTGWEKWPTIVLSPAVALNTSLGKEKTEHTFLVSPIQPLPILSWGGFTRLMLDCHLVLLTCSLFQELLNYPVNPLPQSALERISVGAVLSAMSWLFYWQR